MPNIVEILVRAKNEAGPGLNSAKAETASLGKTISKIGLIAGAAFVAVGVESVKMASTFESQMMMLNTQAGVSKSKIAGLEKGVLALAGKVGQDPGSLAESLYHVESNMATMGITSKRALNMVQVAAEGATVGHADLVDVTNALTAAVASGIPGVKNYNQAMGVLNATVGAGDMGMQDLADAFGTGMLATVKGFGLSIKDVGAALAIFGDNNIRGAKAGTDLRMAVQALASPAKTGTAALKELGLQSDTLAKDMQHGGLQLAMQDLVTHMTKAGFTGAKVGAILTDAFGKKAGTGINIMASELDKFLSKYPRLTEGAHGFGAAWATTQKTFAVQMKRMEDGVKALMIGIGMKLIPVLQSLVSFLLKHQTAVVNTIKVLAVLLALTTTYSIAVKAVALATKLWAAAQVALDVVLDANPISIIVLAIAALAAGLTIAWKKSATFRDIVENTFSVIGRVVLTFAEIWLDELHIIVNVWMTVVGAIVHGAAAAFGWVPGVGSKLKTAAKYFDDFKGTVNGFFNNAHSKIEGWKTDLANMPKVAKLKGDITDLQSKIAAAKRSLASVPASRKAAVRADISNLTSQLSKARAELNALQGKTVYTYVSSVYTSAGAAANANKLLHLAHGGVIGAAGGGARSGWTMVGEHGRELLQIPAGSRVASNPDTERMMSGGNGGGKLQIEWVGGNAGDEFMTWLRKNIRIKGGNVQTVLGH